MEPLGIPQQQLEQMAQDTVAGRAEVVCYDNRVEDVPTLIERSKDADVVVLSNFAYRKEEMQKRAVIVMDHLNQWLKGTPVNVIC